MWVNSFDCEFLFTDPRRVACMLSRETSHCNLPLTYWSGMAIGVSPVNKMLLNSPLGNWMERQNLKHFFVDCYFTRIQGLMAFPSGTDEDKQLEMSFLWAAHSQITLYICFSDCHSYVSAADQEEITLRWFIKSRAGKWCFLALRLNLFVDIKERKRLDMCI